MKERIAIVGATGLVGRRLLSIMERKGINQEAIGLYASDKSEGQGVSFRGTMLTVSGLSRCNFADFGAAFFCVGDELSREYVPKALEANCVVVDKSNTYRMQNDVPLMVPGVNSRVLTPKCRLVANPNCTTIILSHALRGLHLELGLKRIWAATYQSITGAGKAPTTNLLADFGSNGFQGSADFASIGNPESLAFNVHGRIGSVDDDGRCGEENKLINETKKILGMPDLGMMVHCVRVPVLVGHSIAVTVELNDQATAGKIEGIWETDHNVRYLYDKLPTPVSSSQHEQVEVGRFRREPHIENGWSFFVCGDNLHIGAALNGWRILNLMQEHGIVPQFSGSSGGNHG